MIENDVVGKNDDRNGAGRENGKELDEGFFGILKRGDAGERENDGICVGMPVALRLMPDAKFRRTDVGTRPVRTENTEAQVELHIDSANSRLIAGLNTAESCRRMM